MFKVEELKLLECESGTNPTKRRKKRIRWVVKPDRTQRKEEKEEFVGVRSRVEPNGKKKKEEFVGM